MGRSFLIAIIALVGSCAASCSTADSERKPAPPPVIARSSTLEVTNGIKVLTMVEMPSGFAPIPNRPPMWLEGGAEIAVVGTENGHTMVYGLGGAGWKTGRILAADFGPGAAELGSIVDVAASPEGLAIATAVVSPDSQRLDVVIRDLIATGPGNVIASFDGQYDSVSLAWLNSATLALALRRHPEPPPASAAAQDEPNDSSGDRDEASVSEPPKNPADGLQLIVVSGAASVAPVKFNCALSPLSWSLHGVYAVGQGDSSTPPVLIDRRASTCTRFHSTKPIQVLDWDKDDEASFLYVGPDPTGHTVGVYKYNIANGAEALMGVSTAGAAFTGGGNVITLGNRTLTFPLAIEHPEKELPAQVAISQPEQSQILIKSLGIRTLPPMLAQSTMEYSRGANEAAMQIFAPSQPVPWRKIVNYSLEVDSAFQLAAGPATGTVTMSWSPKGRWLALLDGDAASQTVLTVLAPPR
ncbi:MAG TPA: hypothetical protein VEU51_18710 [Candidatus Acidoferrales bacterium]|nr:hypothetical protein [Candidatus Acidoferrales bacterium]